jgi:hypothetical protein
MSLHAIRADLVQVSPEYCWKIIGEENGKEYTKAIIWNASDGWTAMLRYHALILGAVKDVMFEFEEEQYRRDRQAAATNALMSKTDRTGP